MMSLSRRSILKLGLMSGIGSFFAMKGCVRAGEGQTPSEVEGPFYPVVAQKDQDFDLTKIEGREGVSEGKAVIIVGQIVDLNGKTIEGVTVDLWQANAKGRYRHPHDDNPAPLDPNFQGWAIVQSGQNGGFRFKTVMPGAYPARSDWIRPPHIHFKVSKKGYVELTTQMYFPGEPLNETDALLQRKSRSDQALMIAQPGKKEEGVDVYLHNIILEQAE